MWANHPRMARHWEEVTPDDKKLPEHVAHKKESTFRLPGGIPGGEAEKAGTKPSDVSATELRAGQQIEKEHTANPRKATDISLDHLTEIPDYYRRLKEMEAEAEREGMKRGAADAFIRTKLREGERRQPTHYTQPEPYQVDPQVAEIKQAAYHQGVRDALYAVNLGPRS
jgi:hypothetical protein